ncbi:MAG TPA: hypothetical protein VIL88_17040 [Devosia sp.]|jgi:hypothetical protein|uniref:hypothetical protein n=1 Tax=Devosia sp. TaxID=1871048 RepID=UPI002F92D307
MIDIHTGAMLGQLCSFTPDAFSEWKRPSEARLILLFRDLSSKILFGGMGSRTSRPATSLPLHKDI